MPKPAKWSHGTGSTKRVRPDGAAEFKLPLVDNGKQVAVVHLTISADRVLDFLWEGMPGTEPLSGTNVWFKTPEVGS